MRLQPSGKRTFVGGSSSVVGHAEARKRRGNLQLSVIVSPRLRTFGFSLQMMHVRVVDRNAESDIGAGNVARQYQLRVDFTERNAALLDLARGCGDFDIRMERLTVGDYVIDGSIVIERKTHADFATS